MSASDGCNQRVGGIDVTPTLPVADMDDAVRFCEAAGLDVRRYDDGFAFAHLNGQSAFDLDLVADMDPHTNHAGCYIITNDVDDWHARLVAAGLKVTDVRDTPWGMHEFTLTDPSGNQIRIGCTTRPTTESKCCGADHAVARTAGRRTERTLGAAPRAVCLGAKQDSGCRERAQEGCMGGKAEPPVPRSRPSPRGWPVAVDL